MAKVTVPNLKVRAGRGSLHHGCGAPSKVQAAQGRVGVAVAGRAQSPKAVQRDWRSEHRGVFLGIVSAQHASFTCSPLKLSLVNTRSVVVLV